MTTCVPSYRWLLWCSAPLVLSQTGILFMQIVDGVFLAHYSATAMAAVGPAGMVFWMIVCLFSGVVGYSGTFVARANGAGIPERAGIIIWQGIYLAIVFGLCLAAIAMFAEPLFLAMGHAAEIRDQEIIYFRILCRGGISFMLGSALSGFYVGRHDHWPLVVSSLGSIVVNTILNPVLIFGLLGSPRLGIAGAAWASLIGQTVQTIILGVYFFSRSKRHRFGTWRHRTVNSKIIIALMRFGFPIGIHLATEIGAWTVFFVLIGRGNASGLAASNIVWRLNGLAFFPVVGLSMIVTTLVSQAQGANRPDLSRRITYRGVFVGQLWMTGVAMLMLLFPGLLLNLFFTEINTQTQLDIHQTARILLRYMAIYCFIDNINIILKAMLLGAGDTLWMMNVSALLHGGFVITLCLIARTHPSIGFYWLTATAFASISAIVWYGKFHSNNMLRSSRRIHADDRSALLTSDLR